MKSPNSATSIYRWIPLTVLLFTFWSRPAQSKPPTVNPPTRSPVTSGIPLGTGDTNVYLSVNKIGTCGGTIDAWVMQRSHFNVCNCFLDHGGGVYDVTWTIEPSTDKIKVTSQWSPGIWDGTCGVSAAVIEVQPGVTPGQYQIVATGSHACDIPGGAKRSESAILIDDNLCGANCNGGRFGGIWVQNSSVQALVNMGNYAFGKPVAKLSIYDKYPSALLSTPACLGFLFPTGTNTQCEVISNAGAIKQVRVAEGLANIVTSNAYNYFIQLYFPSAVSTNKNPTNGWFDVSGAPFATIRVENPDGAAATNRLNITDGDGVVSSYLWNSSGWDLVFGGGLRKDCKTTIVAGDLRTTTVETYGTNGMESCNVSKYQTFSFGERLIAEVDGIGGNVRSNYFEYYTNASLLTTGLLSMVVRAEGGWQVSQYSTNRSRTNIVAGFLDEVPTTNASVAKSSQYFYGSNAAPSSPDNGLRHPYRPRLTVEMCLGHEVGRSYVLFEHAQKTKIQCVTPGATWNDASNLKTIYKWYDSGTDSNSLKSVEYPDGTMEIYEYGSFIDTNPVAVMYGTNIMYRTNITYSGAPNGGKTAIVDGTKTISVRGRIGQSISRTEIDIASGITNQSEVYSDFDEFNRPKKVTYIDKTFSWTDYGCCGPVTETNREGTVITHYRNLLKQPVATKQNGIITTNILDANGRVVKTLRIGADGSQITQALHQYDAVGNKIAETNALGQKTTFFEGITNYQRTVTITYPDGSTRSEKYYRDGQLCKLTGTAVRPARYEYGTEQDNGVWRCYSKVIKLDGNGNDTSEWTKTFKDMLGRAYKTVYSDGATQESFYNSKGQLVKQVDPDGVTTLYAYNARGEQALVAMDVNRDGIINTNGTDRIRETARWFTTNGAIKVQRTSTYGWFTNNSSGSNFLSLSESTVDGLISWSIGAGVTNRIGTAYVGGGARYVTNTAPDGSSTLSYFLNGLLQTVTQKDSAGTQLGQVNHYYDAHGRRYASTDARNGTTYYTYNDADRVVGTTSPAPGNGGSPQTTTYEHDWAGRVTRTVLPDGTSVTNEYQPSGELKKTYGSRNYPVQYGYDAQGRRTNMITWKNFAADSGKATTVWKFDGYRGFLTNKVYDDGKGPFYSYTLSGRMRTRTWARGVVTTYHTNALGEVFATTYSDGTPAVTNTFDRMGRITNTVDGSGARNLVYDNNNQLLSETNVSGALIGMNLRYTNDVHQRRIGLSLWGTNTVLLTNGYSYDGASRLTNVSDGTYQAGYSYLANSPLISQIAYRSNSTVRMTTTKTYDFLNRLGSISSQPAAAGATPISFSYAYNDANQRTRVNVDDGSFWIYEYDSLGQLVSGKRYWSDWTPVAGQQYEYGFDDIGNRTSTKAGGDASGVDLRSASYTANALNQYTSRDVPAYLNVFGIAHPSASVTVNSAAPYRKGEYFWKELNVVNTSAAQWQAVTTIASLVTTNQTNTGNLFLPKTAESYTYDADGNLMSDGRWTNRWDAENRLIDITSHSGGPTGSRKSLQFGYDSKSRRYSKVVSNWTGSAWTKALDERFLYDGWNLLAAANGTNAAVIRSFLWGLDLSGSMQGAGGVGGLLAMRQHSGSQAGTHFVGFDGNGNVMGLVDSGGNLSGRYEYDPFGQTVRASGSAATINPVRFSSKCVDEETDLAYYGYRYLYTGTGRWLNRDPIDERGGRGIYSFLRNSPISLIDLFGLAPAPTPGERGHSGGTLAFTHPVTCGGQQIGQVSVWKNTTLTRYSGTTDGWVPVPVGDDGIWVDFQLSAGAKCSGPCFWVQFVTSFFYDAAGNPINESFLVAQNDGSLIYQNPGLEYVDSSGTGNPPSSYDGSIRNNGTQFGFFDQPSARFDGGIVRNVSNFRDYLFCKCGQGRAQPVFSFHWSIELVSGQPHRYYNLGLDEDPVPPVFARGATQDGTILAVPSPF